MICSMMLPWIWMPLEVCIDTGNNCFVHCFNKWLHHAVYGVGEGVGEVTCRVLCYMAAAWLGLNWLQRGLTLVQLAKDVYTPLDISF